ncbi:MAG: hypothetical protein JNM18_26960 [Planctomycetaceae bacterium]|nr:hypothetical protein [Planctomycetaceae bacterium]
MLSRYSPLMVTVRQAGSEADQVEAAFLAVFSRKPTANERAIWSATGKDVSALIYALLNTTQFCLFSD